MKKYLFITGLLFSINCLAFDTWWHAECTRKAMVANGFSSDARLATQVSNYLTDIESAMLTVNMIGVTEREKEEVFAINARSSYEFMHFDALFTTKDLELNWQNLYRNTINSLQRFSNNADVKPGFRLIVLLNIIGASLHAVQDFYSHSNWVNTYVSLKKTVIPTWYGEDSSYRMALQLYTGAYPDGSAKGKKNHADLNKDCSNRPLNKEAVEVAERASIEWVKMIMDATPELPWAELKAYNIQNNLVMKNFLIDQDANFLTSSSILGPDGGHLDGPKPVKFIFSKEKNIDIERRLATTVLLSTIRKYFTNLSLKDNIYKLPSPYWSGFRVYLITTFLAEGLIHNGKKYTKASQ